MSWCEGGVEILRAFGAEEREEGEEVERERERAK